MHRLPLLALVLLAGTARAADPVVVVVREKAAVGTAAVTVGDVAEVVGGDAAARDRVARLDLAEITPRGPAVVVPRRAVEYRLRLAGVDGVRVTGADRVTVTADRRPVTADEVAEAARAELLRRLPAGMTAELARPVVAKLPEVPAGEAVTIAAVPHAPTVGAGRVQMDATVSAGGHKLLALGVLFDVKAATTPAAAAPPAGPLVKARERVSLVVRAGGLSVTAVGEAQQAGALGQTVQVQNVDSKKLVTGRVTGPGTVEVELPGAVPPPTPAGTQQLPAAKH